MRPVFLITLLAFLCQSVKATDYYFSSSSGDDSRSASQAKSPSTPWKSINKLNAIFSSLQPGDRILFKRGDTFYGSIKVTKSGTSSDPIVLSAYGSGDKPVITGLVTLSDWTSLGSGRYESTHSSLGSEVNMVTLNGEVKALGRYPNSTASNKGYLTFESHGSGYIKDNELASSPNWEGAELVIRTTHWTIDRTKVTDHSGSVLHYSPSTSSTPKNGYGYFFQNHVRALDVLGEWAYKPSAKKVTMHFGSSTPSNYKVKAAAIDDLVYLRDQNHLVFDNLAFKGANKNIFYVYHSNNTRIQNCELDQSGGIGIFAWNTNSLKVENCSITNSLNSGIDLYSNTDGSIIRGNDIRNSGVFAGMAPSGNHTHYGVRANGNNNLIEYNQIDRSGFCGVRFTGDGTTIKNNLITNFTFVKDDGGGIYTGITDGTEAYNRKITGNIILNGIGAREGTTAKSVQQVSGIYLDNNTSGVTVSDNTVANCGKVGLYVHNSYKITILRNTIFNNTAQVMLNHDDGTKAKVRYINMKENIFFSKKADQPVAYFYTRVSDIASFGDIDYNYYARPLDDYQTITSITGLYTSYQVIKKHTLSTWKPAYDHDPASKKSPKSLSSSVNPDNYIRFVYNASKSNKTISLSGTYVDAKNKSYSSSITLAPYASAVLIKTGESTESSDDLASSTSPAPAAPEVSITSPKAYATYSTGTSVKVSASASDADGSISKVEFYAGSMLLKTEKTAPYEWTYYNVPAGTYTLTAKAYDNSGKVTTSKAVSITVKTGSLSVVNTSQAMMSMDTTAVAKEMRRVNKEAGAFDFSMYPNPAISKVRLQFEGTVSSQKANLMIYTAAGAVVRQMSVNLQGSGIAVDVTSLAPGTYFISLSAENVHLSKKLIKIN